MMKLMLLMSLLAKLARSPSKGKILVAGIGVVLLLGGLTVGLVGYGGYVLWQQKDAVAAGALAAGEKAYATAVKAQALAPSCLESIQTGIQLSESLDVTKVLPAFTAAYQGCVRPGLQSLVSYFGLGATPTPSEKGSEKKTEVKNGKNLSY